jgi:DNA gyrase subunit B
LTFFYRFMRDLVTSGRVFVAQPPLYRITTGVKKQTSRYAWSDEELDKVMSLKSTKGNAQIQRFKGLGEMAASQLWETTMNPESRTLLQVDVEDFGQAADEFERLMGDEVEPRRNFIQTNALEVANLDV